MTDLTKFREALGLADDTTDEAILDALGTLPPAKDEPVAPTAKLPEGVVAVDAATLDQLKADAAAGRQAREDQVAARRKGVVDQAIADGKFATSMREHYAGLIEKDEEGTTKLLAAMPANVIPVEAKGTGADADPSSDDAFYASMFQEVKA